MHGGHLQFQHGSWHNRNYIQTGHIIEGGKYSAVGERQRMTIPIQRPHIVPICDARFAGEEWKGKHLKTIHRVYNNAPFFQPYYSILEGILSVYHSSLERLNIALTNWLAWELGVKTAVVDSRSWHFNGDAIDKIIQMCKAVNADCYLSNWGARRYIGPAEEMRLEDAGIQHKWTEWDDPDEPEPLSTIHHLFMLGPEAKRLIQ